LPCGDPDMLCATLQASMTVGQKRIALMSIKKDSGASQPTGMQQKLQAVATAVPPLLCLMRAALYVRE